MAMELQPARLQLQEQVGLLLPLNLRLHQQVQRRDHSARNRWVYKGARGQGDGATETRCHLNEGRVERIRANVARGV